MLDDDEGDALVVELVHQVEDVVDLGRGEAGGHLVEQQQLGLGGQRLGDLEALELQERELLAELQALVVSTRSSTARARSPASLPRRAWTKAPIMTFSSAVISGNGWTTWNVRVSPFWQTWLALRPLDPLAVEVDGAGSMGLRPLTAC